MRHFTITKTQTITLDKPLNNHAVTKLHELLENQWGDMVLSVNHMTIELTLGVDVENQLARFNLMIDEAVYYGQEQVEKNNNEYEIMQRQHRELSEIIPDYRMYWSVSNVALDDVAIEGDCAVHFRNYDMDDFIKKFTDPTWKDLATYFNECLLKSDDKGHYFMEGIYFDQRKHSHRFLKGS